MRLRNKFLLTEIKSLFLTTNLQKDSFLRYLAIIICYDFRILNCRSLKYSSSICDFVEIFMSNAIARKIHCSAMEYGCNVFLATAILFL